MERAFGRTSFGNVSYLHRPGNSSIVFLHGLGGSSNNWLKLVKYLDPSYSLYFVDLLGHGKSDDVRWSFRVEDQCMMLRELLENLGITNFSLMGHSYGGWVATRFSATYGNPEHLILEDSAGTNPTVGEGDGKQIEAFIDRLQSFGRVNNREVMRKIIIQNSTGEEKIPPVDLGRIKAHTLIIWGKRDRLIDLSYGKSLNESIDESILEIIEGAGHMPHYSHPERVSELINNFVTT